MTKRSILYLCMIMLFAACRNNTVRISGTLSEYVPGEYIYIDELKSSDLVAVDSVKISEEGTFAIKHNVKAPSFYLLKLNSNNFLTMLVEPGEELILKAHHDSLNYPVSVEGSKGTSLMAEYNKRLRQTINRLSGLNRIYLENTNDSIRPALMESLDSMAQGTLNEMNLYTRNYIDKNIASLASLVALYQQVAPNVYILDPVRDLRYFIKVDSSLYSRFPDYEPVMTLHKQVEELIAGLHGTTGEVSLTGTVAPEISLPSPSGDTIRLSSTRGSVVLLDFWASWCQPCRKENPNLVKAYNLYHRKGFQIYQVSLDKTKEAWINGIESDQLGRWIHVSDIQYWNSVVVPLYKFESIPANFLLDRDGKIIASNLRGERLQQKLEEIFNVSNK